MDALLAAPDRRTAQGQRDYALLLFLYNTGARADEAAQLTIVDLQLANAPERDLSSVQIRGKGNKLIEIPRARLGTEKVSAIAQLCLDGLNCPDNGVTWRNVMRSRENGKTQRLV